MLNNDDLLVRGWLPKEIDYFLKDIITNKYNFKYDWKKILKTNTTVHCDNEEFAKRLLDEAGSKRGLSWAAGTPYSITEIKYEDYGEGTCYDFISRQYADIEHYRKFQYKILREDDILISSNIKSNDTKQETHIKEKIDLIKSKMVLNTDDKLRILFTNYKEFILEKNKRYGDSAISPINIFSKNGAENQICNRIDDKLSRIKKSDQLKKNDVADIFGYLALLLVQNDWLEFNDLLD